MSEPFDSRSEAEGESNGAEGGTRTPTVLLPPAPQAGADDRAFYPCRREISRWQTQKAPALVRLPISSTLFGDVDGQLLDSSGSSPKVISEESAQSIRAGRPRGTAR